MGPVEYHDPQCRYGCGITVLTLHLTRRIPVLHFTFPDDLISANAKSNHFLTAACSGSFSLFEGLGMKACLFREMSSFQTFKHLCPLQNHWLCKDFISVLVWCFILMATCCQMGKQWWCPMKYALSSAAHGSRGCFGKTDLWVCSAKINYFGMNLPVFLQVAQCQ